VVLEFSINPSLGCMDSRPDLVKQKTQETFTFNQDPELKRTMGCLEFVILIKMTTNNPEKSQWFVNLLSNQAWASSSCHGLV